MAGIYIHIPFCKQACHYCDFHFSTNQLILPQLCEAIRTELSLQKGYLKGETIKTIYFGGGTPSLLPQKELEVILNAISKHFNVDESPEITLEANPDDLTSQKLKELIQVGINRLSIGIQSFDTGVLKFLNRAHDAESALNCVKLSRDAGFDNLSIDLIYAIPGQDNSAWRKNLEQAIRLSPEHISSYSLSIEKKTTFGHWLRSGKLKATDEEIAAQQFEMLMEELELAGYEQYEISNFSKPGFHSRHNSSYWQQQYYLGVGPSAHSFNGNSRQFNVLNNHIYLKSIPDKIPFEIEILTAANKINEYIFTTLRTSQGCDLIKLKQDHGYDILVKYPVYLKSLMDSKLASVENNILKLTRSGKLLADKIASDLFAEEIEN
ncbi:MAG: radical SAM family heme chaperone HemW [Bacteroidia bacterium]|nr:radical SAM family heme chaperone HemW [Bacteroidia bacterium]